jgi:hypothetical protein
VALRLVAHRAGAGRDDGLHRRPPADGRLRIHSDTQACFFTLDNTALILGTPFNKLRIVGGTVGGGFGGKVDVTVEPTTCVAAMLTNRPVKYVYSRYEEMQISSPRAAERIYIKDGVTKDVPSSRARQRCTRAGAYARHSTLGNDEGPPRTCPGPYSIPNVHVDAHCVLHQPDAVSAMRGFRRHDRRLRARVPDGTGITRESAGSGAAQAGSNATGAGKTSRRTASSPRGPALWSKDPEGRTEDGRATSCPLRFRRMSSHEPGEGPLTDGAAARPRVRA